MKEGQEGKAWVSGVGRKTPETRGGSVGAVIIMMRAGPGGSTEQKQTATSLELSRGRPTPIGLWERAGTSCPRSPGVPSEKIQLPGPEVIWTVLALAFPGEPRIQSRPSKPPRPRGIARNSRQVDGRGHPPPRPCSRGHTSGPAQETPPETRLNPGWREKRLSWQCFQRS